MCAHIMNTHSDMYTIPILFVFYYLTFVASGYCLLRFAVSIHFVSRLVSCWFSFYFLAISEVEEHTKMREWGTHKTTADQI